MKLAFVIPRYARSMVGGAETLAAEIISHLPAERYEVEVWTTCALDHHSWADHFPPGACEIDGRTVRRFRTNKRNLALFVGIQHRINNYLPLTFEDELAWVRESVNSDGLLAHIERHGPSFDALFFLPYLFGVTLLGAQIHPDRSILIPCLHDESYAYLALVRHLFRTVRGVVFNSDPEKELAERLYGLAGKPAGVVGMGFEPAEPGSPERFRRAHGIEGDYILYFGRKEDGKNTPALVSWFARYVDSHGRDLKLVLAGSGEVKVAAGYDDVIVDLDFLDPDAKRDACAGALAVCQPSVNESFSIVLMESWLQERPVLVHALCPVTRRHCLESGGGLYFLDYPEFEGMIEFLRANPDLARRMGEKGRAYVRDKYDWASVLDRFEETVPRILGA